MSIAQARTNRLCDCRTAMSGQGKSGGKTFVTQRAKVGYRDDPAKDEIEAFEDAQASQTSQSTLLLQKKKLMEEAQIELDRKKEEIRLRMLRCQEKEDELAVTQADLRAQVVRFEKFLKDNDAKRLRAHRKALDEIKQREEKEAEIETLQKELSDLHKKQRMREELLGRIQIYEQYLDKLVLDETNEYLEIPSVTARYETLRHANQDLRKSINDFHHDMEEQRSDLAKFIKEAQNQILVMNSGVAEHQEYLELAKIESGRAEMERVGRQNRRKEDTRLSGEIAMSIENLYRRCRIHKPGGGPLTQLDRLVAVEDRLVDMIDIIARAEKAQQNDGVMM